MKDFVKPLQNDAKLEHSVNSTKNKKDIFLENMQKEL